MTRIYTNFNDYWNFLDWCRVALGLGKVEWMKKSGLAYQRYSDFAGGKKNITAVYYLKLLGGLKLSPEQIEKRSKRKYTREQKKELGFMARVHANREWLDDLLARKDRVSTIKRMYGYE